jgi:Xaa-Pro dipeptidase
VLAAHFARRLRASVSEQAILSDPELIAYLVGFCTPLEDWPVGNPLAPLGSVLVIGDTAVLVVANMYERSSTPRAPETLLYRAYDASSPPDPRHELELTLADAFGRAGLRAGAVSVDPTFPHFLTPLLDRQRLQPVSTEIEPALDEELVASVAHAARLADVAQATIAELVEPGRSEAELAGLALAAVAQAAGKRIPAILTVTSGPASGSRPGPASARVVEKDDLVLCDVAPWTEGAWADATTTVCAGRPSARQRKLFDAVRAALELAVELCTPGAVAREIDGAVRQSLGAAGPVYRHHTGHGLGARWWQEPIITSYSETRIEEGSVLAVEPGLYDPEVGGVRLEVTLRVRAGGNELLSKHEHRLTR